MAKSTDPRRESRLREAFLPLEAIAEVVAGTSPDDYISLYERSRPQPKN